MNTTTRPRLFIAATAAALVAVPAASALLLSNSNNAPTSSTRRAFGRPSFVKLDAQRQPFSELDKLRAKRLSIRRQVPEVEEVEVTSPSVDENFDGAKQDVTNDDMITLEYLYESGEERHSDDLFHIILLPS